MCSEHTNIQNRLGSNCAILGTALNKIVLHLMESQFSRALNINKNITNGDDNNTKQPYCWTCTQYTFYTNRRLLLLFTFEWISTYLVPVLLSCIWLRLLHQKNQVKSVFELLSQLFFLFLPAQNFRSQLEHQQ